MTRVLVRYNVDKKAADAAARRDPSELPCSTVGGLIDCGRAVIASWDPRDQALRLKGPQVEVTLHHLKSFSVEVLP